MQVHGSGEWVEWSVGKTCGKIIYSYKSNLYIFIFIYSYTSKHINKSYTL